MVLLWGYIRPHIPGFVTRNSPSYWLLEIQIQSCHQMKFIEKGEHISWPNKRRWTVSSCKETDVVMADKFKNSWFFYSLGKSRKFREIPSSNATYWYNGNSIFRWTRKKLTCMKINIYKKKMYYIDFKFNLEGKIIFILKKTSIKNSKLTIKITYIAHKIISISVW